MGTAIEPITKTGFFQITLAAIVAKAANNARGRHVAKRWAIYERAKAEIDRLDPTPDEYEAAIRMLTKALKI